MGTMAKAHEAITMADRVGLEGIPATDKGRFFQDLRGWIARGWDRVGRSRSGIRSITTAGLPRRLTEEEREARSNVLIHVNQRKEFLLGQEKSRLAEWKLACQEARIISRLMSNRLSQLSFDYIRTVYMGEGDKWKTKQLVKFDVIEVDEDQYRFHVDSHRLPRGRGINEVAMTQDDVITGLGLTIQKPVSFHLEPGVGLWYLVDREHGLGNIPVLCEYKEIANDLPPKRDQGPLTIPIGQMAGRQTLFINLNRETTAHFLIGGTTGGGKSSLLHAIVCHLIQQSPEVVKLVLFDFKMVEFTRYYSGIPHLYWDIVTSSDEFPSGINELYDLVQHRYTLMQSKNVTDIDQYNAKSGNEKMPYIVVIVDELAMVMDDPTVSHKKELIHAMSKVASLGRACGVHLILCTQRPDAQTLPGLVRACCPGRVAFACSSVDESKIVIGNGDAAFKSEVPVGRGILSYYRFRIPFQAVWISPDKRYELSGGIKDGTINPLNPTRRMTHDVTVQELARYAIDYLDGIFHQRKLWDYFRDRGITKEDIAYLSIHHREHPFIMDDSEYIIAKHTKGRAFRVMLNM